MTMTGEDLDSVMRRLARLERENRRLKRGGMLVVVAVAALTLLGAATVTTTSLLKDYVAMGTSTFQNPASGVGSGTTGKVHIGGPLFKGDEWALLVTRTDDNPGSGETSVSVQNSYVNHPVTGNMRGRFDLRVGRPGIEQNFMREDIEGLTSAAFTAANFDFRTSATDHSAAFSISNSSNRNFAFNAPEAVEGQLISNAKGVLW